MKDESKDLQRLIEKFHKGECSPEEELMLTIWVNRLNEHSSAHKDVDKPAIKEKMLEAITSAAGAPANRKINNFTLPLKRWTTIAAAVLIACLSILLSYNSNQKADTNIVYITHYAGEGKMLHLSLPDSSLIYLSAGSSIRFPKQFARLSREVHLNGEAFFKVTRHTDKPFIVHAGPVSTRVLGTQFKVNSFLSLQSINIEVEEGKVQVSNDTKVLSSLTNHQTLLYDRKTGEFATGVNKTIHLEDFAKGHIIFKNASFEELALRVKNQYGYNLIFQDSALKANRFTADFYITQPINIFLSKFCSVYGKSFTIKGKEIFIR
ncbi:FecR family protein [Desertivirga xinjiangensis]|uniref:FecR family protein n=1 Tax=Desertivirga xinjiangensis TaxID=539206 RepID=UPI002108C8EF|nr:FecR family protein [Pedobacter xinjiangensis]